MTVRQLWVRIRALPPGESPLALSLAEAQAEAEDVQRQRDFDDALAPYRKG